MGLLITLGDSYTIVPTVSEIAICDKATGSTICVQRAKLVSVMPMGDDRAEFEYGHNGLEDIRYKVTLGSTAKRNAFLADVQQALLSMEPVHAPRTVLATPPREFSYIPHPVAYSDLSNPVCVSGNHDLNVAFGKWARERGLYLEIGMLHMALAGSCNAMFGIVDKTLHVRLRNLPGEHDWITDYRFGVSTENTVGG